jgi:hypothetical protein
VEREERQGAALVVGSLLLIVGGVLFFAWAWAALVAIIGGILFAYSQRGP